jgi:hypothetical protein
MTPSQEPHLTEQYFTPKLNCNCEVCKDAREQHDATIRKEERERILKELDQTAQHNWEEIETDEGEMIRMVCLGELLAKIEDLRGES